MGDDTATRPLTLTSADGVELEAEVRLGRTRSEPAGDLLRGAVVLAHPSPPGGGSMESLVPAELFRQLPPLGLSALRFNFRGVGGSTGTHDHGRGEAADVVAALDALAELAPHVPLVLCGWSFGADVSLSITDPRLAGWIAVAPPLRVRPTEELAAAAGADPRPTLLLVPEHDQYLDPAAAEETVASWTATTVEVVPGADHFLAGRTRPIVDAVVAFTRSLA